MPDPDSCDSMHRNRSILCCGISTSFPEGEWLASFKESGNGGEITKKNSLYILKRADVDEIPEWLAAEHAKFEG